MSSKKYNLDRAIPDAGLVLGLGLGVGVLVSQLPEISSTIKNQISKSKKSKERKAREKKIREKLRLQILDNLVPEEEHKERAQKSNFGLYMRSWKQNYLLEEPDDLTIYQCPGPHKFEIIVSNRHSNPLEIIETILYNLSFCPDLMVKNLKTINVPCCHRVHNVQAFAEIKYSSITILGKYHRKNSYALSSKLLNHELAHINGSSLGGVPKIIRKEWDLAYQTEAMPSSYAQENSSPVSGYVEDWADSMMFYTEELYSNPRRGGWSFQTTHPQRAKLIKKYFEEIAAQEKAAEEKAAKAAATEKKSKFKWW